MNKPIEVREYDSIICNKEYADTENFTCISEKDFKNLVTFIHEYTGTSENADALDFMRVGFRRGVGDLVTFKNYVGLIQMKNGFQIQVLPKVDFASDEDGGNEVTKRLFLKMLRSMKDFPGKVFNEASLKVDKMSLYEIFINMYLQEVRQLVKHGLKSAYLEQEDNLKFYKGKLLVNRQIKENLTHKERFYVAFEEFQQNRPENRLVKATLEKLQKLTTSAENAKEIRQLLIAFEMVDSSISFEKDFSKVVINRDNKDYVNLMKWSRVFLMNESFSTFSGSTTSRALLFPMESVYESYIGQNMKKVLGAKGWDVSTQDKRYYLFTEPKKQFALRPDIVLKKGNRTIIMDTKWKKLINDPGKNYGISQGDMYQMYAYSKKYKETGDPECPDIWLLYPDNKDMNGRRDIVFKSGDGTTVHAWFLNLGRDIGDILAELETELG